MVAALQARCRAVRSRCCARGQLLGSRAGEALAERPAGRRVEATDRCIKLSTAARWTRYVRGFTGSQVAVRDVT